MDRLCSYNNETCFLSILSQDERSSAFTRLDYVLSSEVLFNETQTIDHGPSVKSAFDEVCSKRLQKQTLQDLEPDLLWVERDEST